MTEIALRSNNGGTVATTEPRMTAAVATLADWAAELDAAYLMARKLCVTSFCPKHFRDKPEEAAAAILTGHELGFSPMASLRSIFNVGGTPGLYAKAMAAVAQSRGHVVHVAEQSDERVVVRGRRKGETEWVETVWDRARVVKAKLTSNAKYQENPQQMMVARGQAEIARQVAADALHGVPYAVEELEDMPPVRVEATVARVTREEILGQAAEPDATEPVNKDQLDEMYRLLTAAGYTTKASALDYITTAVGRPVRARTELSAGEGALVIAALQVEPGPAPEGQDWPQPPETTGLTAKQRGFIMSLAGQLGLTDRDARLEFLSGIVGQPVASSNDLTFDQARDCIDEMNRLVAKENAEPAPDKTLAESAKAQGAHLRRVREAVPDGG